MAKIIFRSVFLLVLCTLVTNCNKGDDKIIVKGTVTDEFTGLAVSGAEINLALSELANGAYSNAFKDVASAISGSDGQFEMSIDRQTVVEYRVQVRATDYFFFEDIFSGDRWTKGENDYDPLIRKEARVEVSLSNEGAANANDKIIFRFLNAIASCNDCCGNAVTTHTGTAPLLFDCSVVGSRDLEYEYIATEPNGSVQVRDTLFVKGEGITKLNISY